MTSNRVCPTCGEVHTVCTRCGFRHPGSPGNQFCGEGDHGSGQVQSEAKNALDLPEDQQRALYEKAANESSERQREVMSEAKATSEEAANTKLSHNQKFSYANDTTPDHEKRVQGWVKQFDEFVPDTTPDSFEQIVHDVAEDMAIPDERWTAKYGDAYWWDVVVGAHNAVLLAELQALAGSNNWRVQLEARIEQLKEAK